MPVVRNVIPFRKPRRLRQTDSKQYDENHDLWETYDESLLAPVPPVSLGSESAFIVSEAALLVVPTSEVTEHIPRPRNAFICFRSEYVKAEKRSSGPGSLDQPAMSRGAADVWRGLSIPERAPYVRMAQEEKEAHTLKYPNYRYAPGNASVAARKHKKAKAGVVSAEQDPLSAPRTYATNPPAPRSVTRRRPSAPPSRPRRKSAAVPQIPAPVAEAPSPSRSCPSPPSPPPAAVEIQEADCEEQVEAELEIVASLCPTSAESYGSLPFGFKDGAVPGAIATFQPPPPRSPSPPPSPSSADLDLHALLSIDEPVVAPPAWDSWAFAPLEMYDDTSPLDFDAPPADFGFFYPRRVDSPSLVRELYSALPGEVSTW